MARQHPSRRNKRPVESDEDDSDGDNSEEEENSDTERREKAEKKKKKKSKRRNKAASSTFLSPTSTITTTSRSSYADSLHEDSSVTGSSTAYRRNMPSNTDEVNDLKAKLAASEAREKKEKAEKEELKAKSRSAGRKPRNKKEKTPEQTAIEEVITKVVFDTVKFVSPKYADHMVDLVLEGLDMKDLIKPKSKENKAKRIAWKAEFLDICYQAINDKRNYICTQLKKTSWKWMYQSKGIMPTVEQIQACLDRNVSEEDEPLFQWWWDEMLPLAGGRASHWTPKQRYYHRISDKVHGVTCANEAFAACVILNNRAKWEFVFGKLPKKVKWYQTKPKIAPKIGKLEIAVYMDEHPDLDPPYTVQNGGNQKEGGWTPEGVRLFCNMRNQLKKIRKTKEAKALEQKTLDYLRIENGISKEKPSDHNRKKPAKVGVSKFDGDDMCLIDMSSDEETAQSTPSRAAAKGGENTEDGENTPKSSGGSNQKKKKKDQGTAAGGGATGKKARTSVEEEMNTAEIDENEEEEEEEDDGSEVDE